MNNFDVWKIAAPYLGEPCRPTLEDCVVGYTESFLKQRKTMTVRLAYHSLVEIPPEETNEGRIRDALFAALQNGQLYPDDTVEGFEIIKRERVSVSDRQGADLAALVIRDHFFWTAKKHLYSWKFKSRIPQPTRSVAFAAQTLKPILWVPNRHTSKQIEIGLEHLHNLGQTPQ